MAGPEEVLKWVKNDRRRLLHVVYRSAFWTRRSSKTTLSFACDEFAFHTAIWSILDGLAVLQIIVWKVTIGSDFGHFGIAVEDVEKTVELIKTKGGAVTREPDLVKGGKPVIAFIQDSDGYKFELNVAIQGARVSEEAAKEKDDQGRSQK
ncbi:hypothetical protein ACQ4PT_025886 [Festuca glaucescens]